MVEKWPKDWNFCHTTERKYLNVLGRTFTYFVATTTQWVQNIYEVQHHIALKLVYILLNRSSKRWFQSFWLFHDLNLRKIVWPHCELILALVVPRHARHAYLAICECLCYYYHYKFIEEGSSKLCSLHVAILRASNLCNLYV